MNSCFLFIQLALGRIKTFPFHPTADDWQQFYYFCKRQALIGVGFTAVEKLHAQGIECPKELRMKWMTQALRIEKRNEIINEQCKALSEQYEHDGLRCCILKGQGNLLNYPEGLNKRRNPGDIDIWTIAGDAGVPIAVQTGQDSAEYVIYKRWKGVVEYVRMQRRLEGNNRKEILRYHHIEAPSFEGTPVEVHFRVGFCHSPLRNKRMQTWFSKQADVCMKNKTPMDFSVPTTSVNMVYQMTHLFSHYFDEGVGLRQLLDYYYVMRIWRNDCMEKKDFQSQGMWVEGLGIPVMSTEEIMTVLRSFGMAKFAAAVMWVMQRVFALPDEWLICNPDKRRGKQLLDEIILSGNFGQYDERGKDMKHGGIVPHGIWKLKRIMRLVRNYPEEALCEPLFRIWHLGWRMVH